MTFSQPTREREPVHAAAMITFSVFVAAIIGLAAFDVIVSSDDTLVPGGIRATTDELWVLIAAALVFFMQGGFLCFEVGLARRQHRTSVAIKNVIDWTIASLAFFAVGFGAMFGNSWNGLIGTNLFALQGLEAVKSGAISGPTLFIFQLAFAGTAMTIVSGSLVERTTFLGYSLITVVIGLAIYPVIGHWVWGGLIDGTTSGWLGDLGFVDFAGASVVHSTGAWVALIGVIMVGPRLGRFDPDGTPRPFPPSDLPLASLGIMILWFGFWGFTGGSTFTFSSSVPKIILVTNLSGAAAVVGSGAYAYVFGHRDQINQRILSGGLSGLVAISAIANVVNPIPAIAIGLIAGILYNLGTAALLRFQIDDALGVIPVHGVAGLWGTLAVALFTPAEALSQSRLEQFMVQSLGAVAILFWSLGIAWIAFSILWNTIGVRVSPARELGGLENWDDTTIDLNEDAELADDELEELLR